MGISRISLALHGAPKNAGQMLVRMQAEGHSRRLCERHNANGRLRTGRQAMGKARHGLARAYTVRSSVVSARAKEGGMDEKQIFQELMAGPSDAFKAELWKARAMELADKVDRMQAERLKLDKRIHNQRVALRENWEIIEMRASHKRAWLQSPLLRSMLHRAVSDTNGVLQMNKGTDHV